MAFQKKKLYPYLTPAAILMAGALIAGSLLYNQFLSGGNQGSAGARIGGAVTGDQGQDQEPSNAPATDVDEGEGPQLGSLDAPVTVVEFADFQCPFCGRFFRDTLPTIKKDYVDTGKVKFVFRNFAFLGQESTDAGMAAYCAEDQGKFWEYHDYLFTNQNGENGGSFSVANLKGFAFDLGLNVSQFSSCLDSQKYKDRVDGDTEAGRNAGVTGTPSTFVNGRMIVGAVPTETFVEEIEKALQN